MKERIKELRRAFELTQQQFAERIGSTQNNIANYETGRRTPSAAALNNICKEFNVNEEWLRTGNGDMFISITRDQEISNYVSKVLSQEPNSFQRRFISVLSRLDESDWKVLEKIALQLSDIHQTTTDSETAQEIQPEIVYAQVLPPLTSDSDIDAEVEDYRHQLLEEREAAAKSKVLRDVKEA